MFPRPRAGITRLMIPANHAQRVMGVISRSFTIAAAIRRENLSSPYL
jgi:hypothetical protein